MNIMTISSSYKITAQISSLSPPQQQQSVLQDKSIDISTREDEQTGLDVPEIEVGKNPVDVAVDPEANRVYVANLEPGSISVIDSSTYEVVANITEGVINPSAIAVDPIENRVYVANLEPGSISVIDSSTYEVVANITEGN